MQKYMVSMYSCRCMYVFVYSYFLELWHPSVLQYHPVLDLFVWAVALSHQWDCLSLYFKRERQRLFIYLIFFVYLALTFCVCACIFIPFPRHKNSSTVISNKLCIKKYVFSLWLYYFQFLIKFSGYDLVNQEKLLDHMLLFILKPQLLGEMSYRLNICLVYCLLCI